MVHLHLGACYVAVLLAQVRDFRAFGRRWLNEVGVHLVLRAVHAAAQADVLPSRLRVADACRMVLIPIDRIRVLVRRRELERWVEVPGEVTALLQERETARKEKNWARADEIRDEITALGYVIEDTPEGAKVTRA